MRMFDEIKVLVQHGTRRPVPVPLTTADYASVEEVTKEVMNFQYRTDITVTWKISGYWTSRPDLNKSSELREMKENFVKQLRKDMYGEIQDRLLKLQRQIYEHPNAATDKDLQSTLRDIMREVWGQ